MRTLVDELLDRVERPRQSIGDEELQTFCKNAGFLKVIRYSSLSKECGSSQQENKDDHHHHRGKTVVASQLEDQQPNMIWYVLFRAVRRFHEMYKRYPGRSFTLSIVSVFD